jgi:hypothetical protein
MKTKTYFLNLLVVVSMVIMAISPAVASATPAGPVAQSPVPAKSGPIVVVSQPVSPARTDGLPAAPTVTSVPARSGFNPDRPFSRLLTKASGPANPSGDAALQSKPGAVNMPTPIVNFEALNNISGYYPPDTNGEVGPNHYVQMVNVSMAVYNKSGTLLYGPFFPHALWPSSDVCGTTDDGDPVVLYDQLSDRWVITQFALPNYPNGPFYECIAVSKTGVPTNVPSDWWPYTFLVSNAYMNDYPKLNVWPDAYYMTANQFASGTGSWGGVGVWALDRAKMLNGLAATFQYVNVGAVSTNYGGMLPADLDGSTPPPAGSPAYFFEVDDNVGTPGLGADAARMWKFHVDWTTPANSTFGLAGAPNNVLPVASFDLLPCTISGSRSCIPQQSSTQKLDSIGDRLMFRATYRNFGDHESVMLNHTVLADGTDRAGVRWYEVRDPSTTPTIYQQGTYAPADGQYRWMGSIAMDRVGNIALGYSVSSTTLDPSIRYAGRLTSDPLGTLPQAETSIITGTGAQTGSAARWGDYSDMTVDPVDDCTFWYTQEYIQTTGAVSWQTRVASFKFPSCTAGAQGTLAGTVSDASNSNPIVGATVQATSGVTQTFGTVSGVGGTYSLLIPVGTYTVTASAYGYLPNSISGAAVVSGTTTTLDIPLTPAPAYVVSGVVKDATTGWPLYASINIPSYPGGTVWTDPVTGFYSVTLVGGTTYDFNVNAWVAGYDPASVSVGPLSSDVTQNFGLTANAGTCNAPGYKRTGVGEGFDATTIPAGWTVTDNAGTGAVWAFNDPGGHGNLTGGTGNFATANSDYNGTVNMDTELRTPVLNLTGISTAILGFKYDFYWYSGGLSEVADVDVSVNGAAGPWTNVWTRSGASDRGPKTASIDISSIAGNQANVMIRFHYYNANYEWWWQVDDVVLGSCEPQAGGLVVGNTYDANTNAALANATVVNDSGESATTVATVDPAVADSFYTLFSPAGSHTFTATMGSYAPGVEMPTVLVSDTVRQDFNLAAGQLSYEPSVLEATLNMGSNTTVPFTLTNDGGAAATFELIELDKGAAPLGPFQKPGFVVKPFRQEFKTARDLGLPPAPSAPPYAAGNVIQSWTPTGVGANGWSVAYDSGDATVWVGDGWGTNKNIVEHQPDGTPTGRSHSFSWNPTNGPADAAYNWNTGKLWVVNVASPDNCIYEIDPATGATGNTICPGGGSGFSVSQRGLAYNPSDDTWYAGSWNDSMIHHFDSTGLMLDEVNVGLSISGLAYNADTQHLFVMVNGSPNSVYVLDAANNYALLGSFSVSAGFADYGGAGLEFDCDGNLWAVDQNTNTVYQFESGETTSMCSSDVPWLSESPITGTVPAMGNQSIGVTFDAGVPQITQPGHYYAQLKIKHNTPYSVANVPVTLTVSLPQNWGTLNGTVTGLAYCDAAGVPLDQANVFLQSGSGMSWTLTTNASGAYGISLDATDSPLTATVSAAGFVTQTLPGITVSAQMTTTQNFDLRLNAACQSLSATSFNSAQATNETVTKTLTINNAGAGPLDWVMTELAALAKPVTLAPFVMTAGDGQSKFTANAHPATKASGGSSLAPTADISITESASQSIITGNSVACNNGVSHTDNSYYRVFDLPTFGISGQFNVTDVEIGVEQATAGGADQPITVNLYTLNGTFIVANLTLIGSATVNVANQSLTHLTIPVVAAVPAGSKLVVEIFTPNGAAAGNLFFIGSNNLGETAPSYLRAVDCGVTEPQTTASIGFPDMQIVMNVYGSSGPTCSANALPWVAAVPASGTVAHDSSSDVGIVFDSTGLSNGIYTGTLCLDTNDTANPQTLLPVTLTVASPAQLTVNTVGNGTVGQNPPPPYVVGDVVTLTANAATGWSFAGWSGDLTGMTNPAAITLTGNNVVTATFTQNPVNLTVNVVGSGAVTPNPVGPYLYGDVVTLTASAATGWSFAGWSGDLTGMTNPAAITLNGSKVVTATFTHDPVNLTVNVVGSGMVTQEPVGPYLYGDVVTLTASADTGWSFAGWSGDLSGMTSPITIELTSDQVVTATFTHNPVNLTVNVVGTGGGTVTQDPASPYLYGDVVTLTANAATNWAFAGWSGDLSGTTNPITITLTGDKVVTATFTSTCVPVSNADFTYLPTAPKVGQLVTFNGTVLTGTAPITYSWNYGDGSAVGSGTPITHLFPITVTTHSYTVTLTAANACGTVPVSKSLTVRPQTIYLPIAFK